MGAISALFSFKGRMRRRWFMAITVPIYLLALTIRTLAAMTPSPGRETAMGVCALAVLVLLWPGAAAYWKRNHDQDRSGWWSLLAVVPLLGFMQWMLLLFGEGRFGPNRFGPDPTLPREVNDGLADMFA